MEITAEQPDLFPQGQDPGYLAPSTIETDGYFQIQNQGAAPTAPSTVPTAPTEPPKKKRGRPPKNPNPNPDQLQAQPAPPKPMPLEGRKPRGRPPGSKNKIAKGGPPLIPHVLTVMHGEDIVEKLKEISRSYARSLCVLAASGTLSTATLMQVGAMGQAVGLTLKTSGVFTILSISGSVLQGMLPEVPGQSKVKSREPVCALSASLANPTGGVVGGQVGGPLEVAGVATLVIGHWEPEREKQDTDFHTEAFHHLQSDVASLPTGMPLSQFGQPSMAAEMPNQQLDALAQPSYGTEQQAWMQQAAENASTPQDQVMPNAAEQ